MMSRSAWIAGVAFSASTAFAQAPPPGEAPGSIVISPAAPEPEPEPEPAAPPALTPAPRDVTPSALPPQGPAPKDSADATAASASLQRWRDLAVQVGVGVNGRFGDASSYARDSGIGPSYSLGFWLNASKGAAFGLELTHTRLGHGSAEERSNLVDADFSASAAWLAGRFFPYRSPDFGLYLGLRLGLAVQHVAASGLAEGQSALVPATVFDCSGTRGPALGLGAGVGGVVRLSSRLELVSELGAHGEQLTSDRIGNCANGVGSGGSLGWGIGVAYGFDVGGGVQTSQREPRRQTW